MPSIVEWEKRMDSPAFCAVFDRLSGSEVSSQEQQIDRYRRLLSRFGERFGPADVRLISVPGRTEIGGNHTDHNHGRVLAAAIHLDAIAAVAAADDQRWCWTRSVMRRIIRVTLDDLHLRSSERGTTAALVRGIAARFQALGHQIGGFRACLHSQVGIGSV
jgi:galactokinase